MLGRKLDPAIGEEKTKGRSSISLVLFFRRTPFPLKAFHPEQMKAQHLVRALKYTHPPYPRSNLKQDLNPKSQLHAFLKF